MLLLNERKTLVLSNSKSEKIDADLLHIVSQNDSACEPWVKELNLFQKDMNILRSKKEWINDDIINAAQHLLKDINPALSGFQSTACGLVYHMGTCVVVPPRYLEDRISWLCFNCRN